MNYLEFYGLNQEPFSNAPVSKFFFNSAQHSKALMRLMYAAESMKGLALLVGDTGAGKTTLARRLLDQLPEDAYEAALLVIIHSGITAEWLLKRIATQLGVAEPAEDRLTLLSQLYKRLVEIHEKGKKAVVLIDEAQMLQTREIMEEFRGILNLELPGHKLLTFVFFGLPELEENLKLDPPLANRIALRYHLEPLNDEATRNYVEHRLRLAGKATPLFEPDAISEIHRISHGVPRLINTICDNALFEGSLLKRNTINGEVIRNIARDLGLCEDALAARQAQAAATDAAVRAATAASKTRAQGPGTTAGAARPLSSLAPKPAAPAAVRPAPPAAAPKPADPLKSGDDEIDSILDKFGG